MLSIRRLAFANMLSTDLTAEARILYSSDSIVDVLGWKPEEIVNHSAWNFFMLEEAGAAQLHHQRRVEADKAAVLAYVRLRNRDGDFVGCEVCFTVVYDVMVVCTSIYRQGLASESMCCITPLLPPIHAANAVHQNELSRHR